MATQPQIERIRAACAAILEVPLEQLVENREKWGPHNFIYARPFLERIYFIADHLNSLPVEVVIDSQAEQIAGHLEQAKAGVVEVAQFDPMQGNPNQRVQELTSNLRGYSDQLVSSTASWIPFLAYQRGDVAKNIAEMRSTASAMSQLLGTEKQAATERRKEIDGIVKAAREAAAEAGVGVFTSDFANQATMPAQKCLRFSETARAKTEIKSREARQLSARPPCTSAVRPAVARMRGTRSRAPRLVKWGTGSFF